MISALWAFVVVSVVVFSLLFLRPPWTVESVLFGGIPLLMVIIFCYRFWRAKKGQAGIPSEKE